MDPFQKHPGRLQDAEEDVANDHNVASRRQLRQTLATLSRTTGPSGAQRGKDLTDFLVEEARKLNRTYVTPAPETTGRGMRAYGEEAKEHEAPKMPYVAPPISHQSGNVPPEKQQQKSPAPVQTHLPPKKEKKWPPLESIGAPKVPKLQTRKEALSSPLPRVPTPSRLPVPILHPGYVRKRAAPKQQGLENEKSLTSPTSPAPIPPGKGSAAVARRRAELAQAGHFGPSRLPVFGQTQNKENASNIPQTPTPISQIPAHISQIPTRIPQVPTQIPHTPTHAPAEKPSVRERRKKPSLSINVPASLNINTPAHPSASTPPVRESNSPRKTPKTPKRHGTLVSPVDADFLRRQIESVIGPIQPSPPSPTTQQTVPALNFAPVSHCASIHNAESPRPGSSVYSFFPRTPHSSLVSTMGNTQSRPLERSAPRRASFDASYMAPGGSQLPLSAPRRNSEPSLGTYGSPLTAIQSTPGTNTTRALPSEYAGAPSAPPAPPEHPSEPQVQAPSGPGAPLAAPARPARPARPAPLGPSPARGPAPPEDLASRPVLLPATQIPGPVPPPPVVRVYTPSAEMGRLSALILRTQQLNRRVHMGEDGPAKTEKLEGMVAVHGVVRSAIAAQREMLDAQARFSEVVDYLGQVVERAEMVMGGNDEVEEEERGDGDGGFF